MALIPIEGQGDSIREQIDVNDFASFGENPCIQVKG
jgi:hypothetical protein